MRRSIFLMAVLLEAGPVGAHGTLPGGGGFYAGAAHPFLALEHLLALLTLGLLLGRGPRSTMRLPLLLLAKALGAGLLVGTQITSWHVLPILILSLAMAMGAALATRIPLAGPALGSLALLVGIGLGMDTGVPSPVASDAIAGYAPYLGVLVGTFLIVLNAMALASVTARPPFHIAVRIVGSWVSAAALMVLALEIRRLAEAA